MTHQQLQLMPVVVGAEALGSGFELRFLVDVLHGQPADGQLGSPSPLNNSQHRLVDGPRHFPNSVQSVVHLQTTCPFSCLDPGMHQSS